MRIHIDVDRCEGHGLCVDAAPAIFDLDDDAVVVLRIEGDVPEGLRAAAEAGVRVCPVTALRTMT